MAPSSFYLQQLSGLTIASVLVVYWHSHNATVLEMGHTPSEGNMERTALLQQFTAAATPQTIAEVIRFTLPNERGSPEH